ncbi:MAG: GTP-binding protein [Bryobacterales bacterium]
MDRKVSISTALAHVERNKTKLNLLDTPGYNIFINEAKASLLADCALVTVDAVAGVEVQTEKVWSYAEGYGIPRIVVVNKMARERADFEGTVQQVKDVLGAAPSLSNFLSTPNATSRVSSTSLRTRPTPMRWTATAKVRQSTFPPTWPTPSPPRARR